MAVDCQSCSLVTQADRQLLAVDKRRWPIVSSYHGMREPAHRAPWLQCVCAALALMKLSNGHAQREACNVSQVKKLSTLEGAQYLGHGGAGQPLRLRLQPRVRMRGAKESG